MYRMIGKVCVVGLALMVSQLTLADAESELKYRKAVMKVVGGHMGSIGTILRGGVHMEDLKLHANGMASIAQVAPHVFPEGTDTGKTNAKANIWQEPEDFKMAMDKFVAAADNFAVVANAGDMANIGGAVKQLGGSCKGCHDDYKKE